MNSLKKMAGIFFLILIFPGKTIPQSDFKENTFPLTIPFIDIYDLDTTYKVTWKTRTILANKGRTIDKYIYRLVITITVMNNDIWNKPFALVYELPGYKKEFIIVNDERYDLLPDSFNQFIVEVRTTKKGWAKFELAEFDELTGRTYVPQNTYPLRRRDFLFK